MPGSSHRELRSMVISAALGALALVLPLVFHMIGLGSRFLPMLLPLLLNGYLSAWPWAAATGILIPWVSAFSTGMPPIYPPVAAVMCLEGATLASVAAWSRRLPLPVSLPLAILAGRAVAFAGSWALARLFHLPPAFASAALLVQGIPGVVLQLVVVPLVLRSLKRRRGLFADETNIL